MKIVQKRAQKGVFDAFAFSAAYNLPNRSIGGLIRQKKAGCGKGELFGQEEDYGRKRGTKKEKGELEVKKLEFERKIDVWTGRDQKLEFFNLKGFDVKIIGFLGG